MTPGWYVYIISNNSHTLYVGATSDLPSRIHEHKSKLYPSSFTARYTFDRCVYIEYCASQADAIRRERQIKSWSRAKKVALIQKDNPNWLDLSSRWSLDAIFS
jgi:putative endonuclease